VIAVARGFVPVAVCQALVECFERHIAAVGRDDAEPVFSFRVLRLRDVPRRVAADETSVRQMRAIRWLAAEHLREVFGNPHVYPEETQIVRWSAGDGQPLHLDSTRPTTTYAAVLYLNDGFGGGETFFEDGRAVAPRTGTLVGFHGASRRHGVRTVTSGTRLTMPMWFTDVAAIAED